MLSALKNDLHLNFLRKIYLLVGPANQERYQDFSPLHDAHNDKQTSSDVSFQPVRLANMER